MPNFINFCKLGLIFLLLSINYNLLANTDNLEEIEKVQQTIEEIGYFTQISRKFKYEHNNIPAQDIIQIYEYASSIIKGNFFLKTKDPWGDKWLFGVKDEIFFC